jgi:UTP--glucose-1-phosphate uridylyltransferase
VSFESLQKLYFVHGLGSVDERILQHMIDTQAEFLMEVTDKTKADIKVRIDSLFIRKLIDSILREALLSTMRDLFVCLKLLKFHLSMSKISSQVRAASSIHLTPYNYVSRHQSANSRYSIRITCGSISKVCLSALLFRILEDTYADISALKRVMETEGMELEIIINPKTTDDGHAVVQVHIFPSILYSAR